MLQGVYKRPPIDLSHLTFSPSLTLSEEEIVDEMERLLRRAVGKRLSDNVACLTSGGVDSGIVTAMAAQLSDKPIKTFTLTYRGENETEGKRTDREYARWLSEICGTEHHEEMIGFDDFPVELPHILQQIGEPFSGYVSVHFISRFAKRFVATVMSGDWPDELFGSYKAHRMAFQNPLEEPWRIRYSLLVFNNEEKKELYSGSTYEEARNYSTLDWLKRYFRDLTAEDSLNRMLEDELRSFFPDHTYMSLDRLSRAHSLNIDSPYSDPEFVQLAARIPGHLKMKNGETKYILKKLAVRLLPKEIVYRKKDGFVAPTLPLVETLEEYVRMTLAPVSLMKHGLFNADYVQSLVDEFYRNGIEDRAYKIWTLVCFQVWYEGSVGGITDDDGSRASARLPTMDRFLRSDVQE